MGVAPQREHRRVPLPHPLRPRGGIGERLEWNRNTRPITDRFQRVDGAGDIVGLEIEDEIHIRRETYVAVRDHRKPAGNQVAHASRIQGVNNRFDASLCHAVARLRKPLPASSRRTMGEVYTDLSGGERAP